MTSYEHFMLGVTGTVAAGLHRRFGWPIAAAAGLAAVAPDWDGLSLAFGAAAFDRVHRAWGHNLAAAALLGAIIAALEYRFGWIAGAGRRLSSKLKLPESGRVGVGFTARTLGGWGAWLGVGTAASLSHVATDMLFSGHATLSDWGIRLLWPFSERAWVYPMVSWGDPAVSILFAAGMLAMAWRPERVQRTAAVTLAAVIAYVFIRGWAPH
ncbi:MAG: metal-dependent hydrolase [Pirellulales bacterium]|nr:metal-dependent hydrolase [Pirellulales bacterium]